MYYSCNNALFEKMQRISAEMISKIDVHHHLIEEAAYEEDLLREMDRFNIERSSLIGLGSLFKGLFVKKKHDGPCADNNAVARIVRKHPDRFFGLGFIRLGVDKPEMVDKLADMGFVGLKFIIPKDRYSIYEFFPVYEKAQDYGMPCLFHTGIVSLPHARPGEGISSFNMDAIHVEAVAQEFPDLKIIVAHFGVQSYITVIMMLRAFKNVYADISANVNGWMRMFDDNDWKKMLWFEQASKKILFATDVNYIDFAGVIEVHEKIFNAVGWNNTQKEMVYKSNAESIFPAK